MATERKHEINLGLSRTESGRRQVAHLVLVTRRHYNGGIISDAKVFWVEDRCRSHALSLGDDIGDFSEQLKVADSVRATQKSIDTQHAEVFTSETIEQLTAAARAHYANRKVA